ncbi:MAG: DUF305 domain-containing protein [Anaerolineae bacterium]|nr:DUF305 domain-containing protein [Gemmatimonadaceae bacterium]
MKTLWLRANAAILLVAISIAGCSTASRQTEPVRVIPVLPGEGSLTPAAQAKADSGRPPYTAADVRFMQGMIPHHSQALVMAGWAPTHAARPDVLILAQRIEVAQRDEIELMARWLRDRREAVPADTASHHGHAGLDGQMLSPGMLTADELSQLERATGPEFDRLFLTFMIRHHEGALAMVAQLLASPGAAQDTDVYRFSNDVNVDQITEIDRMRIMLRSPTPTSSRP